MGVRYVTVGVLRYGVHALRNVVAWPGERANHKMSQTITQINVFNKFISP